MEPPAAPSWTLHVTALFVVLATAAVNVRELHELVAAGDGVTDTLIGAGGAVTVTVAVARRVVSAWLVATTLQVPAAAGAVYTPAWVIVPQEVPPTDQVTALLVVLVTVAVKVIVPPAATDGVVGAIDTAMAGGGAVTVTVAVARRVVSAWLVATTLQVPAAAGAVYTPAWVIVPQEVPPTDQVTALLVVLVTVAVKVIVPPAATDGVVGAIDTAIGGAATVTVLSPMASGSTALVARTWNVPGVAGAV
jgi:hypothetical protein